MSSIGTQSKSVVAFGKAAVSFDVHESDFLVLLSDGIKTYEPMGFRFPEREDFESYLKNTVRLKSAYRTADGELITFERVERPDWESFRSSEDAGCLRKLWTLAHQVAKREVEALASAPEGETKIKVTEAVSLELEETAVDRGLPPPGSDRERPSLHTLSRVQANFAPGGAFSHLPWKCYIDLEFEQRLKRQGRLPKDKPELTTKGNYVKVTSSAAEDFGHQEVKDLTVLREVLDIRARAFHLLSVMDYDVHVRLTSRYVSLLRQTPAEGFRRPTINELRRTDRVLFQDVLSWVAKGKGKIGDGVAYHLDDRNSLVWKLMILQPESVPDQGIDEIAARPKRSRPEESDPSQQEEVSRRKRDDRKKGSPTRLLKLCLVCKKRHEPLCPLPPGFRKEQRLLNKQAKQKKREEQEKNKAREKEKKNK